MCRKEDTFFPISSFHGFNANAWQAESRKPILSFISVKRTVRSANTVFRQFRLPSPTDSESGGRATRTVIGPEQPNSLVDEDLSSLPRHLCFCVVCDDEI